MKKLLLSGGLLLVFATGCAHIHTPSASKFEMDKIPEFRTHNQVALINAQDNTTQDLFARNGPHKFYANYKEWTDSAITIARREISKRGGLITDGAEKTLKLSVLSSKVTSGGWGFRGYAELYAKAGNGYEKIYKAEVPSSILYRAADGALARAVIAMLSDKQIVQYLSN